MTLHNTKTQPWLSGSEKAGIELSSQEHQPVEAGLQGTGLVLWERLWQLQTPLILCDFILGLIKAHVSHWLHPWDIKGKGIEVITKVNSSSLLWKEDAGIQVLYSTTWVRKWGVWEFRYPVNTQTPSL